VPADEALPDRDECLCRIGSNLVPGYGLPAYGDGITDCDSFE
jgi:hypothetical protein